MAKKKRFPFAVCIIALAALLFGGCDMTTAPSLGNQAFQAFSHSGGSELQNKIDELVRNGHYLLLYHLPSGTTAETIRNVSVSDGSANIAVHDGSEILIAPDSVYINAYIPLAPPGGGVFDRTGSFITAFQVQIDALARITVSKAHNVIVPFTAGRGTLDIEALVREKPEIVGQTPDPETEQQINDIIAGGGYIHFYTLPRNVSKNSFSAVSVSNAVSVTGVPTDYQAVAVRKNVLDAEAFVPIQAVKDGLRFSESGDYYISFQIVADALIKIIVLPAYADLYYFTDGAASVDASKAPAAPARPQIVPHCLTVGGLPAVTGASNIFDVYVYNSSGIVAKCADYTKIAVSYADAKKNAVIPLVYDNNKAFNGKPFDDFGDFYVSFVIYPDAGQVISVTLENGCLVSFTDGSGFLDISGVPAVPRNCLTITNLPANFQELNAANVFVWNQAGKIAQCQDYSLLEIIAVGATTTVRIPLVYVNDTARIYAETGPYYVSFDLNVDALTRIAVTESEKVLVSFYGGKGTLDASTLPQALPTPYLTIIGLPENTAKGNFSEVFLYNAVGKIARCYDYQAIVVTKSQGASVAMVPLAYDGSGEKEYFRDSGDFVVTFTVNIDINIQIVKARADSLAVAFKDGSGELDLSSDYGFFSGSLVNPADTSAPVLKAGTVFEMNGAYEKLTANTGVTAQDFPTTRIVYVYAVKSNGVLSFVYSDSAPVWNAAKKGYYLNNRRALYKLVYLKGLEVGYAAKTPVAEPWKNFDRYPLALTTVEGVYNKDAVFNPLADKQVYSLSGASNPAPQTYTASPGWYIVYLNGAGGGGGGGTTVVTTSAGGNGGDGGTVAELVYIAGTTTLSVFTGGGGTEGRNSGNNAGSGNGGGGGGGGSGSFVYHADGYFLCAGGGGGGGGSTSVKYSNGPNGGGPGGGGGAGGSIGSGGGGGLPNVTSTGSSGSAYGPGATHWGYGGLPGQTTNSSDGGTGGSAAYFDNVLEAWKNTAGANGQGGSAGRTSGHAPGSPGGAGGNNRDTRRGGGAYKGGGAVYTAGAGAAGSVTLYKLPS
jgi:hypothetical protein